MLVATIFANFDILSSILVLYKNVDCNKVKSGYDVQLIYLRYEFRLLYTRTLVG